MNCVLFAKMDKVFSYKNKTLKKNTGKWKQNTRKFGEFCKSGKVGTMISYPESDSTEAKKHLREGNRNATTDEGQSKGVKNCNAVAHLHCENLDAPSPLGVRILSISCRFWENLGKSYICAPLGLAARSCGKVMFSQECVKNSVHPSGGQPLPPWTDTPLCRHPL